MTTENTNASQIALHEVGMKFEARCAYISLMRAYLVVDPSPSDLRIAKNLPCGDGCNHRDMSGKWASRPVKAFYVRLDCLGKYESVWLMCEECFDEDVKQAKSVIEALLGSDAAIGLEHRGR